MDRVVRIIALIVKTVFVLRTVARMDVMMDSTRNTMHAVPAMRLVQVVTPSTTATLVQMDTMDHNVSLSAVAVFHVIRRMGRAQEQQSVYYQ